MFFWKNKKKAPVPNAPSGGPSAGPSAAAPSAGPSAPPAGTHSQSGGSEIGGTQSIKNIVAIASGKGGVGKSTVAANLAIALQKQGYKVGLMDADIYGPSQPTLMGSPQERAKGQSGNIIPLQKWGVSFVSMGSILENDGPVVWRAPMAIKILQQFLKNVLWGELDFLLIDLPPGTGDVQITLAQQAHLTGAIIVTTPQEVAVQIARKGLMMFEQVNVPILGIVENMSAFACKHCGESTPIFHSGGGKKLAEETNSPFLGAIPLDPEIMLSGDKGLPILEKDSSSPSAKAYLEVTKEFLKILEKQGGPSQSSQWPNRFQVSPNGEVLIEWADGHQGFHTPFTLRLHCPCANCVDENTGKRTLEEKSIPLDIKAQMIQRVGRYGVSIRFSDGHGTGIYKFQRLLDLCECPVCLQNKGENPQEQGAFQV